MIKEDFGNLVEHAGEVRKRAILNRLDEEKRQRLVYEVNHQMEVIREARDKGRMHTTLCVYDKEENEDLRKDVVDIFKSFGYGVQRDNVDKTYYIHW